jgi:hypothetical protein
MKSTFRGMQIDFNEQSETHDSSIRTSRNSLSNAIESNSDLARQDLPRILTFEEFGSIAMKMLTNAILRFASVAIQTPT